MFDLTEPERQLLDGYLHTVQPKPTLKVSHACQEQLQEGRCMSQSHLLLGNSLPQGEQQGRI